jgi:hypothetical protein
MANQLFEGGEPFLFPSDGTNAATGAEGEYAIYREGAVVWSENDLSAGWGLTFDYFPGGTPEYRFTISAIPPGSPLSPDYEVRAHFPSGQWRSAAFQIVCNSVPPDPTLAGEAHLVGNLPTITLTGN